MTNLFEILNAAIDNTGLDMTSERAELESELTEQYIDEYASNGMGIELSTSQIRRVRNVGLEWIKDVNEGNGEWSRMQHEAQEKLSDEA